MASMKEIVFSSWSRSIAFFTFTSSSRHFLPIHSIPAANRSFPVFTSFHSISSVFNWFEWEQGRKIGCQNSIPNCNATSGKTFQCSLRFLALCCGSSRSLNLSSLQPFWKYEFNFQYVVFDRSWWRTLYILLGFSNDPLKWFNFFNFFKNHSSPKI